MEEEEKVPKTRSKRRRLKKLSSVSYVESDDPDKVESDSYKAEEERDSADESLYIDTTQSDIRKPSPTGAEGYGIPEARWPLYYKIEERRGQSLESSREVTRVCN